MRNVYAVHYRMSGTWDKEKAVYVIADSKADAYDKAVYEVIPETEPASPYSAWVHSVTYQNGNVRYFNTFEGNPY